jgi:hypothetical protein
MRCTLLQSSMAPHRMSGGLAIASVMFILLLLCQSTLAADPPAKLAATSTAKPGPFRALVPGVEVTIPPDRQEEETYTTRDIVEVVHGIPGLDWTPKLSSITQTLRSMSTKTAFRRDIWCLEFTFKPVRMLWVDVPQASGKMQRKLIWYMVYHVKNTGKHLRPVEQTDGKPLVKTFDRELRFFPEFVLEAPEYKKAYLDRLIPVAIAAIQQKEDPNRRLFNSVEISSHPIPVSSELVDHGVWGVATWEEVDPRVDFFSVSVQGLSNAYQWVDPPNAFKAGDAPGTGRVLLQKTLVLNFWRPGDEYVEDQRIIRYGIPGKVDYSWVYR